jgi:hypothetical protein
MPCPAWYSGEGQRGPHRVSVRSNFEPPFTLFMPVVQADFLKKAYRKRNPNHMNDSIQNLHNKIKKEVNVEIGRENLIECR